MGSYSSILYVLNTQSNESRAMHDWRVLRLKYPQLPEKPYIFSDRARLTSYLSSEKPQLVVAAGGDGTVNAVCNAVLASGHSPDVAILPLGYGNALAYCLGVETVDKALDAIFSARHFVTIDVIRTSLSRNPYAVFYAGVGYDAKIVHTRTRTRYIGFRSYVLSAISSFFEHVEKNITITIDHSVTLSGSASTLAITNSPIINRNYVVVEQAKLNDGYLDCILFSTKYAYLTNLRFKGFKHPLYSSLNKIEFKAKHIRIEGNPYVQLDGDPVEHPGAVEFSIEPLKIRFVRQSDEMIDMVSLAFN